MSRPAETGTFRRVLAVVRHPLGGVRTHLLYTYPLLAEAGYRFTLVLPAIETSEGFRRDVEGWADVEVVEAPMKGRHPPYCWFLPTVRRLLAEKRFALIHSHGLQAAAQAVLANIGFGLPHVLTSHDVFDHHKVLPVPGRVKMFVLAQALRRLDAIVAVSEDTREDHLRHLPALRKGPCRIVTIHNGIRIDQFAHANRQPSANLRERLEIGADVCLMGFLGRFMEQKGFLPLVDALSELIRTPPARGFHLLAVGSGDCRVNYERYLAHKPELDGTITFLDYTPDMSPIFRELDLLVMPSLWEAHPLLPMEAMLVGVPVIGTSCLGLREVLRGSPSVMVPPNDPKALARALTEAIANPWTEEAREYVPIARKRFDVRQTAEKLRNLFDGLTASHRRSRASSTVCCKH